MFRRLMLLACVGLFAAGDLLAEEPVAREPKVGCSIAFAKSYLYYDSNEFFRQRPISVEMLASGIDFCLYNGPTQTVPTASEWLASLKRHNCVWLILEHELECPFPAADVGSALREYVSEGGGLVINHSPGRYPEAPVDGYWDEVFTYLDMERLHEEVSDLPVVTNAGRRALFHTSNVTSHPVTENVAGLWLVQGTISASTWGVHAICYSSDWTVVIATSPTGKSYYKDPDTNAIDLNRVGTYTQGSVPIVAVRQLGKGRVVSIAEHKDVCGWAYNLDRWPNLTERSEWGGLPSDNVTLLQNAFKWAGAPSMDDPTFTAEYEPVEPLLPPYEKCKDLRLLDPAKWAALGTNGAVRTQYSAVVGLHSSLSDGSSTVAEYAAEAKKLGLSAIIFTDPLESLGSSERLMELREACAAASDATLYCCPGVEYTDGSDIQWILSHDRVTFPPAESEYDGLVCPVWDGKRVLQRNLYGGHKNLYRGAVIDYGKVHDTGNVAMNLAYFSGVIPKAYAVDSELCDNTTDLLRTPENMHRAAPMSFTRIRSAADLSRAYATSAMYANSPTAFSEVFNSAGGWGTSDKANSHQVWVRCGGDVSINRFATTKVSGTQLQKVVVDVLSDTGLSEVKVCDGTSRVIARFACDGEKRFVREFTMTFDRQSVLQLIATDKSGGRAYSSMLWLQHYHAGLFRCGDNSNLMSCNPKLTYFSNWNDMWCPFDKVHFSRTREHRHISESFEWDDVFRPPTRLPSTSVVSQSTEIKISNSPIRAEERVSNFTTYPLNMPSVVTIVDQIQGETLMEKSSYGKRLTYAMGSLDRVTREDASPFVHRRRVHHFIDRFDSWWYSTYHQVRPEYRGGYTLVEGEISFTQSVTLTEPIYLCRIFASLPEAAVPLLSSQPVVNRKVSLGEGDYAAFCPTSDKYYAFFGLSGSDPSLCVRYWGTTNSVQGRLQIASAGTIAAGSVFRYRFALATLLEDPRGGAFLADFARKLDGTGFSSSASCGSIVSCSGVLDAVAEGNRCTLTLSGDDFIEDFPVRVSGLADNGSAWLLDEIGRPVRALAFCDGKAYANVSLEEGRTWRFQNLFVAGDPRLRFTYIPQMIWHTSPEVEIQNTSADPISCSVTNLLSGQVFSVSVAPGASVATAVTQPNMSVVWKNTAGDYRLDNSANWGFVFPDGTNYTTTLSSPTDESNPLVMTTASSLSPNWIYVNDDTVFDLGANRSFTARYRVFFNVTEKSIWLKSGIFGIDWGNLLGDRVFFGDAPNSRCGRVRVTGSNAVLSSSAAGTVQVGVNGSGYRLDVTDGALLKANLTLGNTSIAASNNVVLISGAGSRHLVPAGGFQPALTVGGTGGHNTYLLSNAVFQATDSNVHLGWNASSSNNRLIVSGGEFSLTNPTTSVRHYVDIGRNGKGNTAVFTAGAKASFGNVDYFCIGNTAAAVSNTVVVSDGAKLRVTSPALKHNFTVGNGAPYNGLLVDNASVEMPTEIIRLGSGPSSSNNWMRLVNHATVDVYRVILGELPSYQTVEVDNSTLIARLGQIQLGANNSAGGGHLLHIHGPDARVESLTDEVVLSSESEIRFTIEEGGFRNSPVLLTPRGLHTCIHVTAEHPARIRIVVDELNRSGGTYTLIRSTTKNIDLTNIELIYDHQRVSVQVTERELIATVAEKPSPGMMFILR